MPICGNTDNSNNHVPYFKSLKELDDWKPKGSCSGFNGILKYSPRQPIANSAGKGKLLVCHDYKGGYTESLFARSYTFNYWSRCDTFVYFSHHRITVPPTGWISAAHRQGVKILGTLIFEGGGEEDCLRLLIGKMPSSRTGQVATPTSSHTLPVSPHYATVLADLAKERGFDGYLLNFECPLKGGVEQTRALAAWITLLQSELLRKVGSHATTLWYDSVVFTGQLAWQDRLNSFNLPFFLSSSGLFSNYTWGRDYPSLTAQYFLSLDPSLIGQIPESQPYLYPKTLQDIYMGVDVWGRGSHGGGGLGCYRAISHIAPESLGLSVALFGQAWTWETEQDKPGWTWDKWWEYERTLWAGPISGTVDVPEAPRREGEPECPHGPFLPLSFFFPRLSPPDPFDLPFHSTFCPGVGQSWFVEGIKVFGSRNGWTDVDKQCSVGDMVWPRPSLSWEDEREDVLPEALSSLCMDDAWNGGSSLSLSLSFPASEEETAAYRSVWIPIQSLTVTHQRLYEAQIIYKLQAGESHDFDTEFALALRTVSGDSENDVRSTSSTEFHGGWSKLKIEFTFTGAATSSIVAIGLIVAVVTENPDRPLNLSLLIGQLNVHPRLPDTRREHDALVLWADFAAHVSSSPLLSGSLTWEVATTFPRVSTINIKSPEDPISAWNLQPTINWFPSFVYFNVYAQPFTNEWNVGPVADAVWIGTSGLNGEGKSFNVLQENLPFTLTPSKKVRFYIQGLTDQGDVLPWNRCAFVDVSL